jgi:hypothetical protein
MGSALMIAGLLAASARAEPTTQDVSFSLKSLSPKFGPYIHDYVVRCNDAPVTVKAHAANGWEMAVADHPFRRNDFTQVVGLKEGREFAVIARDSANPSLLYRYYVRCLPSNFPRYTFTRYRSVSPEYFSVDRAGSALSGKYAMIFNNQGVPIWWRHTPARDPKVLANGTVLWFSWDSKQWGIHRLDGSPVRTLRSVGRAANPHDLQVLDNGHYQLGAYVTQRHVNTSAYGGSSDANVVNAELQQVSPDRRLVWDWKSQNHISLDETPGYRWPWIIQNPLPKQGYDILHWNSIEADGKFVIASFRHLDAVYKIRKSDGYIVWKLGGTKTPKSLTVKGDPRGYTLGAQHDARVLPDGTLTVFDNRTNLGNHKPRAVRFRIDEAKRTATLIQSISDPEARDSHCCGSARRLDNGEWLINWAPTMVAGYTPGGRRTFRLAFNSDYSYRAEPVPANVLSAAELRAGMDAMYGAP